MDAKHNPISWAVSANTVIELFDATVREHPDRVYVRCSDLSLTYSRAAAAVQSIAEELGTDANGKDVALVMPNSAAFLVAYFGVLLAGAKPALINHAHPDAMVAKLLGTLDAVAVLSNRKIDGVDVTELDDQRVGGLLKAPQDGLDLSDAQSEDTGAILFSGGTTGVPKQVAHSNDALLRKIERMEWGWPTTDHETWLPVAPFTHVYGFLMGVLNPVLRGGTLVIPPRFHPDLIVEMLQSEKVSVFGGGPPAIYQAIMASEKFAGAEFPELRVCPGGGAPFPKDLLRRWQEATALPITEGYGMTEIAPISVNTVSDGMKPGAAGKPVPDTSIEIVDVQNGTRLMPEGESGEIRVKGPHMMSGYTGDPDETAIAIRDGYVYTGDIGMLDAQGFLTISDRKKDVIFVKGFNVFPREVEETLLSHPAVSGACVVARNDVRAGEVPVAFVTLREPATPQEITVHCGITLIDHKVPSEITVLDDLPLTPAGKVDRQALRAEANETG